MPDPILVGRNLAKLQALAKANGIERVTTDLDAALADPDNTVYFDAQTTGRRADAVKQAIAAGKHVYCEKPTAVSTEAAYELYEVAKQAGVKNGVVQDKLWLPGLVKLKTLDRQRIFRRNPVGARRVRLLGVRGRHARPAAAPELELPQGRRRRHHRRYALPLALRHRQSFRRGQSVSCLGATHVKERIDEQGKPYRCTADDSAYATFELENGVIAHFNSSWSVRVRRDDLLTLQVDGTKGSAVAGLRDCVVQHDSATPRPTWNPDIDSPIKFLEGWTRVPDYQLFDNAFKIQWEMFLRHVVKDEPWRFTLLEGAKGVQLAEKGLESWEKRCWVDLPPLEA